MFKNNGIDLTMDELRKIFTIVDEDKSGSLSLEEFQIYTYDKNAQDRFREQIKLVKERFESEKSRNVFKDPPYLPTDFNSLFSHLY